MDYGFWRHEYTYTRHVMIHSIGWFKFKFSVARPISRPAPSGRSSEHYYSVRPIRFSFTHLSGFLVRITISTMEDWNMQFKRRIAHIRSAHLDQITLFRFDSGTCVCVDCAHKAKSIGKAKRTYGRITVTIFVACLICSKFTTSVQCLCVCVRAAAFMSLDESHFLANARCRCRILAINAIMCLMPDNNKNSIPLSWLPVEVKLASISGDNIHCSQIAWLESVLMWRIDWSKKNTRNLLAHMNFATDVLNSFLRLFFQISRIFEMSIEITGTDWRVIFSSEFDLL